MLSLKVRLIFVKCFHTSCSGNDFLFQLSFLDWDVMASSLLAMVDQEVVVVLLPQHLEVVVEVVREKVEEEA